MTIKDTDRRIAFWLSFTFVGLAPVMVYFGGDLESIKASAYAFTTLGVANYFSKPTKDT